jgi:tRNA (cmo5U34)-methyltransferase
MKIIKDSKEDVGDGVKIKEGSWSFEGDVVKTFDSHVSKSVPFYKAGHDLIEGLSHFFIHDESLCYDIGCSTGSLINKLSLSSNSNNAKFIGIDSVQEMIDFANSENCQNNCEFVCENVLEYDFEKSDLIVLYYTLQFIKPSVRQLVIDKLYESLNWGGALLLFEKVRAPDARFQDISTLLYSDYKASMGYSSEEILNKAKSLKGILEPFSTQGNLDILSRSGFKDVMSIYKYITFEGFIAIK